MKGRYMITETWTLPETLPVPRRREKAHRMSDCPKAES
jgi:hypothetical protein